MNSRFNIQQVEEMLVNGATLQAVADHYGVSRQRIGQVRKTYLPHLTRATTGASFLKTQRDNVRRQEIKKLFNRESYTPSSDEEYEYTKVFKRKRQNCKTQGKWEFTLAMSDLDWPTHCPILGMELDWSGDYRKENSPSFDRTNSREGYIPGNVRIVSWRANRIKNDGSAEEHRKIAEYLDSLRTSFV
jgi:hypothetical protein